MKPDEVRILDQFVAAVTVADLSEAEIRVGDAKVEVKRQRTGRIRLPDPAMEPVVEQAPPAIRAHMVGFFHPAAPPLSVGDSVTEGMVVGRINVLGLDNEIRARVSGTVSEVLVEPEMPLEYGQTLFFLGGDS